MGADWYYSVALCGVVVILPKKDRGRHIARLQLTQYPGSISAHFLVKNVHSRLENASLGELHRWNQNNGFLVIGFVPKMDTFSDDLAILKKILDATKDVVFGPIEFVSGIFWSYCGKDAPGGLENPGLADSDGQRENNALDIFKTFLFFLSILQRKFALSSFSLEHSPKFAL